jgi:hypothetical protein
LDLSKGNRLDKDPGMVFIIGMGRSGTSLLTNMLHCHENIIATPENEFIISFKSKFEKKDFSKLEVVEEFVAVLKTNYNKVLSFWEPTIELKNAIISLSDKSFASVCKQVYLHYPFLENKNSISYIVDKNPVYSLYIPQLMELFPTAKFIILYRDYRSNVVSRKKYSEGKSSLAQLAASWNYYYEQIHKTILKLHVPNTILRYEDLVAQPEQTLKSLCSFLEIDYSDSMLNYQSLSKKMKHHASENASEHIYNKIVHMHGNLEKPLDVSRIADYTSKLNSKEIDFLDQFCGKIGRNFNYLPAENNVKKSSFLDKIKYQFSHLKISIYYIYRKWKYGMF